MRVTFPHMGTLWIVVKTLFEAIGQDVVVPPPITQKTIALGVRHSPEMACFPLKVNMGNFIEGLERGADTILMAGGSGPCRFGYYAQVQREILKDLGYSFNMIAVDPPDGDWRTFWARLRPLLGGKQPGWKEGLETALLVWEKLKALDDVHHLVLETRPFEKRSGAVTRCHDLFLREMAELRDRKAVRSLTAETHAEMSSLREAGKNPLRVAMLGEIYMCLEPTVNMHLEKLLGEMGVYVERTIYLSHWLRDHILADPRRILARRSFKKCASRYLDHFVGGHGWESVGKTVRYAREGFDGVVHLFPFTCGPEVIAQGILLRVSRDYDIPVLSLSMDEHSSETGLLTRLETFVDMLSQRRTGRRAELCT